MWIPGMIFDAKDLLETLFGETRYCGTYMVADIVASTCMASYVRNADFLHWLETSEVHNVSVVRYHEVSAVLRSFVP